MAKIKVIKDEQLKGGIDNTDVYPVSSTQALYSHYMDNGEMKIRQREYTPGKPEPEKLEDRLKDHEDDAVKLHKESEKLTPRVIANSSLFEITGNTNEVTLTGSAQVEVFNPDESKSIPVADMSDKALTLRYGSTTDGPYDTAHAGTGTNPTTWIDTIQVPNNMGTYTGRFDVTYNGVSKYATTSITATLRKYFSYADSEPTDTSSLEALRVTGTSDISTSTKYIFTVPPINAGEKHIYFAVPKPMYIINIIQPSVGPTAQFAFHGKGTVDRVINGVPYKYNLYESGTNAQSIDGLEDTSYSKELQIELGREQ